MIVFTIDRSCFSIGAFHRWSPVSLRSRWAFLRNSTGWYVSGTKRVIMARIVPDQIMST